MIGHNLYTALCVTFYTAVACASRKIISQIVARKWSFLPRNSASRFLSGSSGSGGGERRLQTTKNGAGDEGRIPLLIFSPKRAARCERGHARMIQNINIARFPHNSRVAERVTHARRRPKGPWRPRMSGISPDRGERKRERRWKEEDADVPAVCVFVLLKAQGSPLSERPIVGYELPRKTRSLRWKTSARFFFLFISLFLPFVGPIMS